MPFVQAKCPECGGMLAVDDSKKAAMCQFCGEAFIVQEAIINNNTYNTYNTDNSVTHNYGDGAVVNVYEDKTKDFVIEAGVLKEYHGASLTPVVPEGVVAINGGVFKHSMITKITLPSTLKELRASANSSVWVGPFYFCKYLKEINLPEGLKTIPNACFQQCDSLTSVEIPDSVTIIGQKAFQDCTSLTAITIPNGVTSIGSKAFAWCNKLTSVKISNGLTSIGDDAFKGCINLKSVTISESATNIYSAFQDTPWYKEKCAKEESERQAKIQAEQAEKQRIIAERKSKGICQHCGGAFKGLFSSKCSSCGKPKDY